MKQRDPSSSVVGIETKMASEMSDQYRSTQIDTGETDQYRLTLINTDGTDQYKSLRLKTKEFSSVDRQHAPDSRYAGFRFDINLMP